VSIVFALLLAALAVFMIGYFNNWWGTGMKSSSVTDDGSGDTIEITKFKDPASRLLVLKAFKGSSVYCCGDYMTSSNSAIVYRDGKWYVGDDEAEEGSFDNRSIITENENIEYLALVNMGMKDCSDLAVMEQLTYLDISGNPVNDIGFLKDLENIQVLKIIDIDAEDLSVLADMPKLKYLYIDKDRYDEVTDVIDSGTVDIVVKK
jgi:Leucine-rich repeat (LRR) protein